MVKSRQRFSVFQEGLFHQVRVIELRHNRHPHHVLYKDQLGSLLAVPETPDGTYFPLPRRGMVMVSAEPTTGCSVEYPSIGVCWSFCISNLIWLAPNTGGACLQHNSTVGIHAGNVLQYARVLETTFSCDQLTHAISCLGANSDSVVWFACYPLWSSKMSIFRTPQIILLKYLVSHLA